VQVEPHDAAFLDVVSVIIVHASGCVVNVYICS
jgi:hypothetical protein